MSAKSVYAISFVVFVLGALVGTAGTYSYMNMQPPAITPPIETVAPPEISPRNEGGYPLTEENATGTVPAVVDDGSTGSTTIACTMDAKICPDGSAVGRVAPSCEFAPCPGR